MARALYNFEYRCALAEMGHLVGRRLDKFFEPATGVFRLDFGPDSLIVGLGKYFYLAESPPKAPNEPSGFAMLARKYFAGSKLSSISQHKSDRIFIFTFQSGNSILIEMFSGGNLFLLNGEMKIIRPYHFKQTEKKQYRAGDTYEFPSSAEFKFPPGSAEWGALPGDAPLSSSLAKWPVGKLYALEALSRAKISPERTPADLSDADVDLFLKTLSHMLKRPHPCAYLSMDGAAAEVSLAELSAYPAEKFTRKDFPSVCNAFEFYYSQEAKAAALIASQAVPPALKKLRLRLEGQRGALAKADEEIAEMEKLAKFAAENLFLIEGRIEEINSGASCPALSAKERLDLKKGKYYISP